MSKRAEVGRKTLNLRLYVAGPGQMSARATSNLAALAARAGFRYELETVDVLEEPSRADVDHVVVTPTLVKLSPPPRALLIGDLSDSRRALAVLGVPELGEASA